MEIYCIGGSSCSGESTLAQRLSEERRFFYYKVDDYLERFLAMGAKAGYSACARALELAGDG